MGKKVLCPNCGVWHYVDEPDKGTFESAARRLFTDTRRKPHQSDAAAISVPLPISRRETPQQPTLPAHVQIPFNQALISGFFAAPLGGVAGYGLAMIINAIPNASIELTGWGVLSMTFCGVVLTGFSVAGAVWSHRLGFYDSALWTVEEIFGRDLNLDGNIGEPEPMPEPKVLKVEVVDNHGIPRKLQDLPIDLSRFKALAELVISGGKGFSERVAGEAGISQKEFGELRRVMVERGWAAWKHPTEPRQGASLSREGNNVLRATLSLSQGDGGIEQGRT